MEPLSLSIDLVDLLVLIGICHGFFLMALMLRHPQLSQSPARYVGFMVGTVSIIGLDSWFVNFDWDEAYYLIDYLGDDVPWVLLFYIPLFRYFLLELGHLADEYALWSSLWAHRLYFRLQFHAVLLARNRRFPGYRLYSFCQ